MRRLNLDIVSSTRLQIMALLMALSTAVFASSAKAAIIWSETGDAGELVATAQRTAGLGNLGVIQGQFGELGIFGETGVDLFGIRITDPSAFSVQLSSGPTLDTYLWLFDEFGAGLLADDNAPSFFTLGNNPSSEIPLGRLPSTVSAGDLVYLGVSTGLSFSGEGLPLDDLNQEIFDSFHLADDGPPFGDPDQTFLPQFNGPLTSWTDDPSYVAGSYTVTLTGAGPATIIPEPTSSLIWILGAVTIVGGGFVRSRRGFLLLGLERG